MSPRTATTAGLCLAGLAGLAGQASAQIDYRNLDDERPVTTEDAYPVERHAFEWLVSYRFERERGGEYQHLFPLGIKYGVYDNTHIGLEAPLAGLGGGPGADTDWGLTGLEMFALYNFNSEGPTLPALSVRTDISLPVGSLAGASARASLKAIATRSWGLYRFHLNAVRSFGSEDAPGAAEVLPRWRYSAAVDRTLFRHSLLLVGEMVAVRAVRGAPVEVNASTGVRYQWSPTFVLDAGVTRRLREVAGPDYGLTLGLSHTFGLGWLMPGRSHRPRGGT